MENKNNASQTAMLIASLRALACYEEDPRIPGKDYLAELFIPEDKRIPLKTADYRHAIRKAIPEGLYEYVIARTGYYDDLFEKNLYQQTPQIVLLGAGYDSRAYRYANQIKQTDIYEVDTWATQSLKCQILKDNAVDIHPKVHYVNADFEQKDWFKGLFDAGLQSSLQTLYLWEGVTFYLTPNSVASTLKVLSQNSLPGSVLSFDYQHSDIGTSLIDTGLEEEIIKFGLNSQECDQYMKHYGYTVIEKVDSEVMKHRYLTMSDGKSFGEVKAIMNIVTAQID